MKQFNDTTIEGNTKATKEDILRDLTVLDAVGNAYKTAVENNIPKEAEKQLDQFKESMKMFLEDILMVLSMKNILKMKK